MHSTRPVFGRCPLKARPQRLFFALTAVMAVQLWIPLASPQDSSLDRMVHLSFVEGQVTVERPDLQVWAEAPVNTPLQQGFKVSTGENSFAELQFENGDTIRVGQIAVLSLGRLVQTASGNRNSRIELQQGYATIHTLREDPNDVFEVATASGVSTARGSALFRVDLDQGLERVEVFQGTVEVRSERGTWMLGSDAVLVLQPDATAAGEVSQGITEDDWDHWVEDRDNSVEEAQTGPPPGSYTGDDRDTVSGWNELQQNGNWSYLSGAGYGWMPTTVAADWAPYSTGQWSYYSPWGYTWIAAEPWGWLPFHHGGWQFVPGSGWMWFPGNLGSWSPAQVDWYRGPGWIGWSPRSRPGVVGPAEPPCARTGNCGGLAMSLAAFGKGGTVNAASALAFSPITGQRIGQPGIPPTTAILLPGRAVPRAAAGVPARSGEGVQLGAKTTETMPPPRASIASPDANIVYDPQARSYVNIRSTAPAVGPTAQPADTKSAPLPSAGDSRVVPMPVQNPELRPGTPHRTFPAGSVGDRRIGTWGNRSPRGNVPSAVRATAPPPNTVSRPVISGGGIEGGRGGGAAASAHRGGVPAGAGRR